MRLFRLGAPLGRILCHFGHKLGAKGGPKIALFGTMLEKMVEKWHLKARPKKHRKMNRKMIPKWRALACKIEAPVRYLSQNRRFRGVAIFIKKMIKKGSPKWSQNRPLGARGSHFWDFWMLFDTSDFRCIFDRQKVRWKKEKWRRRGDKSKVRGHPAESGTLAVCPGTPTIQQDSYGRYIHK